MIIRDQVAKAVLCDIMQRNFCSTIDYTSRVADEILDHGFERVRTHEQQRAYDRINGLKAGSVIVYPDLSEVLMYIPAKPPKYEEGWRNMHGATWNAVDLIYSKGTDFLVVFNAGTYQKTDD